MSIEINTSITTTITCDMCGYTKEFECDDVDFYEAVDLSDAGFVDIDDAILCEDCADPDAIFIGFIRKFGEQHLYGVCTASTQEEAEQALDEYAKSVDVEIADCFVAKTNCATRVYNDGTYYKPAANAMWVQI